MRTIQTPAKGPDAPQSEDREESLLPKLLDGFLVVISLTNASIQ